MIARDGKEEHLDRGKLVRICFSRHRTKREAFSLYNYPNSLNFRPRGAFYMVVFQLAVYLAVIEQLLKYLEWPPAFSDSSL